MEYLGLVLAFILAIVLCAIVYKWLFTPHKSKVARKSAKRIKRTSSKIGFRENQRVLERKIAVAGIFRHVPLVGMNNEEYANLHSLISAVDKRTNTGRLLLPEEIYIRQLLIAGVVFLVVFVLMFINPLFLFGLLAIPLFMRIPVKLLEAERKDYAIALADEFLAFYKLYYVQFIQPDNTTTLSHVINSYIPSASTEVKQILKVLDGDLAKGEEFALKRFDARFPDSPKVHKFCAVARARLKGDQASFDAMHAFLDQLIEEHDVYFNRERDRRENRISRLVEVFLMVCMSVICIVVFAMMIGS